MRRREAPSEGPTPPVRLQRFHPSDWPDAECHPECAFWSAWDEWSGANPEYDAPLEFFVNGPDTPWHPEEWV